MHTKQLYKRSFLITYLKLGYLLHMMTLLELIVIFLCFKYRNLGQLLHFQYHFLETLFLSFLCLAPIFPQLDARSRYQNYKQVKDHLYNNGFQQRLLKPFLYSRCQRDAVLTAAEELGLKKDCANYFKNKGYRWYHLLPDFIFQHPSYLFSKAFWLNTFFAKYYSPKYNFKQLKN